MKNQLQKLLAELLGTYFLVFIGCGSLMSQSRYGLEYTAIVVPAVFGVVIACMIYALGHISGAHFNPAVTIAFASAKRFPIQAVPGYLFAQCLGSLLAVLALKSILPPGESYGATVSILSSFNTLVLEFMLSFVLMFVIISVATDARAVGTMSGLAIGGAVFIGSIFGGPLTGASMNPARSLGPAVFQGELSGFWIYAIGPILGAVAAVFCYEFLRGDEAS